MSKTYSLEVTARPARKDGNFWVTSFWMFGDDSRVSLSFEVGNGTDEVVKFIKALRAELESMPLPDETYDGWTYHVVKPVRWPQGFKKFERATGVVSHDGKGLFS